MSDYLTNLAHTLVHPDTAVQPRRPARFEPARRTLPALGALAPVETEAAQADDDAPTAADASDAAPAAPASPVHPPHRSTPAAGNRAPVARQHPLGETVSDPAASPPVPPASAAPAEDVRRAGPQATPAQPAASERSAAPVRDELRAGHAHVEPRRPHIPPLANPATDAVTARDSRIDDIASVPAPPDSPPSHASTPQPRRDRAVPTRSPQPVEAERSQSVPRARAAAAPTPEISEVRGAAIRGIEPLEQPRERQPAPRPPADAARSILVRPVVVPTPQEADTADSLGAANAPDQPAPTIHVTIGRVEVRATTPAASQAPAKPARRKPAVSLDAYLARRNGGQS